MYPKRISCLMTSTGSMPIMSARSATDIADGKSSTGRRGRASAVCGRGAALSVVVRFVVIRCSGQYTPSNQERSVSSPAISAVTAFQSSSVTRRFKACSMRPRRNSAGEHRASPQTYAPRPESLPVLSTLTPSSGVETILVKSLFGPFAPQTMHVRRGTCLLAGVISVSTNRRGVDCRRLHRDVACRRRHANLAAPAPRYPLRTG